VCDQFGRFPAILARNKGEARIGGLGNQGRIPFCLDHVGTPQRFDGFQDIFVEIPGYGGDDLRSQRLDVTFRLVGLDLLQLVPPAVRAAHAPGRIGR